MELELSELLELVLELELLDSLELEDELVELLDSSSPSSTPCSVLGANVFAPNILGRNVRVAGIS